MNARHEQCVTMRPRLFAECLAGREITWLAAGMAVLIVFLFLRSWPSLFDGSFRVEDTRFFSIYYGGEQPLVTIGDRYFHQPYRTVVSNFFVWCFSHCDVRMQPYLYQGTGFLFSLVAVCCLFFSGLIRSPLLLLLGPSFMGLVGLNHIFYFNTLIYVMYVGVLILLSLFLLPPPASRSGIIVRLAAGVILPWSGPYSLLALPVALLMLPVTWKNTGQRLFLLLTALSTFLYLLTVEGSSIQLAHLHNQTVLAAFFRALLDRIVFLNLAGQFEPWLWLPILLGLTWSLFAFRHDRVWLGKAVLLIVIIPGALALFFLSSKFPLYGVSSDCHRLISLYFWCFYLLCVVDRVLEGLHQRTISLVFFSILLVALVVYDTWHHPQKRGYPGMPGTGEFLADVRILEQKHLKRSNQFVVLELRKDKDPFFILQAVVGSRQSGARQLMPEEFPQESRSRFIIRAAPR